MSITLYVDKSIEENAGIYFDKSKKAKAKLAGAQEAIALFQKKLVDHELQVAKKEEIQEQKKSLGPQKWYHKFRWFRTSEGYLVAGGRDATTNDVVVKKHASAGDLVFHTEMPGSPFFILKARGSGQGKDLEGDAFDQVSKEEVARATATFSKAWSRQLGTVQVYCVSPDQLKKEMGLPKGTFMVYGKREYFYADLDLCVGMTKDSEVMAGPRSAVSTHCVNYFVLSHGNKKASTIGKEFVSKYGGDLDTVIRSLPGGEFVILEHVHKSGSTSGMELKETTKGDDSSIQNTSSEGAK